LVLKDRSRKISGWAEVGAIRILHGRHPTTTASNCFEFSVKAGFEWKAMVMVKMDNLSTFSGLAAQK
jgi:hypothetical protein